MKVTSNIYIWTYLFLAFFGIGFLALPGGAMLQKISISALCILILLAQGLKIKLPHGLKKYFLILIILTIFSAISSLVYSNSIMFMILVTQKYLFLIVSFIAASQIFSILKNKNFKTLDKIIVTLVITQFIFVILKFSILGEIQEGFLIGSMSHNAGQLGFLFPAIMIPIVLLRFFNKNIKLAIILITMLILFAILNEKRAIFYLGPLIIFFSLISFLTIKLSLSNLLKSSAVFLLGLFFLSYFTSNIDSLSGEEGSIETSGNQIEYLIDYGIAYLTMDYGGDLQSDYAQAIFDRNTQLGRVILWIRGLDLYFSSNIYYQIFGHGFGYITPSEYINPKDIIFQKLGFRGAISGALMNIIEGGLISFTLYSFLVLMPLTHLYKRYQDTKSNLNRSSIKRIKILTIVQFVFIFDFFFYSTILFSTSPLPLLYFIQLFFIYMPDDKSINAT